MTLTLILIYNAFVLVVDLLTLYLYQRRPKLLMSPLLKAPLLKAPLLKAPLLKAIVAIGIYGVVTSVMALAVGRQPALGAHLYCHALFIHLPLLAMAMAFCTRKISKPATTIGVIFALLLIAVGVDAFFIEPHWLEVTHHRLTSSKIKKPIRIIVIADIQTDNVTDYEARVIRTVKEEKPDIVLFAGDYLQAYSSESWLRARDRLNQIFKEVDLQPSLGMYAVQGNVDSDNWPEVFQDLSVEIMQQSSTKLIRDDLAITGLSVGDSFDVNKVVPAIDRFHICLGHSPDFALGDNRADLLIAGHTHGGQVQIPLIGPILTLSKIPNRWASGLTQLAKNKHLIVSRGIGMERGTSPRIRFFCRPQIVVIDVVPDDD